MVALVTQNTKMIFLIGYRAVGKTTVGRRLAEEFCWDFIDLDEWICDNADRAVSEIVKDEGWEGFRKREKDVLRQSFNLDNSIVATGGGAVLHQEIWAENNTDSLIVWLTADTKVLCQRLMNGAPDQRPSLTGAGLFEELDAILAERTPLYKAIASITVATDDSSIDEIVSEIATAYRNLKNQN